MLVFDLKNNTQILKLIKYHVYQIKTRKAFETTQVYINKKFQRKIVNSFLPINFNICFGCSKEPSH